MVYISGRRGYDKINRLLQLFRKKKVQKKVQLDIVTIRRPLALNLLQGSILRVHLLSVVIQPTLQPLSDLVLSLNYLRLNDKLSKGGFALREQRGPGDCYSWK